MLLPSEDMERVPAELLPPWWKNGAEMRQSLPEVKIKVPEVTMGLEVPFFMVILDNIMAQSPLAETFPPEQRSGPFWAKHASKQGNGAKRLTTLDPGSGGKSIQGALLPPPRLTQHYSREKPHMGARQAPMDPDYAKSRVKLDEHQVKKIAVED